MSIVQEIHRKHLQRRADWERRAVPDRGIDLKNRAYAPKVLQEEPIPAPAISTEYGPTFTFLWGNLTYSINETVRFADIFPEQEMPAKYPRVAVIIDVVSGHFGISKVELLAARRTAGIVKPRQIAIYLTKQMTLRSLPEIGQQFGGRDHTTVLHSINKIERLLENDADLPSVIETLKQKILAA